MARHVYRYRSIIDECSCSTDGRPSYSSRTTIVPITSPIPEIVVQQDPYFAQAQYLVPTQIQHANYVYYHPTTQTGPYNNNFNNSNINNYNNFNNNNNINNNNNNNHYYNQNQENSIPIAVAIPV